MWNLSLSVHKKQQAIFFTFCSKWVHRKCDGTSVKEHDILIEEDNQFHGSVYFVLLMKWLQNPIWIIKLTSFKNQVYDFIGNCSHHMDGE